MEEERIIKKGKENITIKLIKKYIKICGYVS